MKAIEDRTTLVIVGAFNPAILSPQWVAKFALKREDKQELQVQMLTQVGAGVPARLSFDDISYSPSFGSVTFHLDHSDPAKCEKSVNAAANIFQELPHTPISGVGFNFAFNVSDPGEKLLAIKIAQDELTDSFSGEPDVVIHRWGNSISWEGALVNIDCEFSGGDVTITFNFHYSINSAKDAEQLLRNEGVFIKHYAQAQAAASALSGENLE